MTCDLKNDESILQGPCNPLGLMVFVFTCVSSVFHVHVCVHVGVEELWSEADSSCSGQPIHLWQFLRELLLKPHNYGRCIRWLNKEKGIYFFFFLFLFLTPLCRHAAPGILIRTPFDHPAVH